MKNFKINHIVKYNGKIGVMNFVKILDIVLSKEEVLFYTLIDLNSTKKEKLAGYPNELSRIVINEGLLQKLGFSFDDINKVYSFGDICIKKYILIEGNDPLNLTYNDFGFRLISCVDSSKILSHEDMLNTTLDCSYLDLLQELCYQKGIVIDFDKIN